METSERATTKACCADLYQSELARMVLGDTLHPGGLRLTNRLGRLMEIQRDTWVVDLASGSGPSASAISRTFHCKVVGIEYSRVACVAASGNARNAPVPARAWFLQGDAEFPPLRNGHFDGVLSECSLSLFPDKPSSLFRAVQLLKPGGKLGISDVTLTLGSLPAELNNSLGQILCLSDALPAEGYVRLMSEAGLTNIHKEDASESVAELLGKVRAGLSALTYMGLSLEKDSPDSFVPGIPAPGSWVELLERLEEMVGAGDLGYWLFIGEKP